VNSAIDYFGISRVLDDAVDLATTKKGSLYLPPLAVIRTKGESPLARAYPNSDFEFSVPKHRRRRYQKLNTSANLWESAGSCAYGGIPQVLRTMTLMPGLGAGAVRFSTLGKICRDGARAWPPCPAPFFWAHSNRDGQNKDNA
jgi:hypothetical protein